MENQERYMRNDGEIEIDLMQILRLILSKIWIILLVGVITGLMAFIGTKMFITPLYQSTAKLYVINRQNESNTTYNDVMSSTQLVKDYRVLVTSQPVVEAVINQLDLDMTEGQLKGEISCAIESDSRVLNVTVTDENPYMAKRIVDAVADVSAQKITAVMKIEAVNIIEYGREPQSPASPNTTMNTLLGIAVGLFITVAVIIIRFMLDDSIKTADDVEKYLGVSTLALLPVTKEEYDGKSSKSKKRKIARK